MSSQILMSLRAKRNYFIGYLGIFLALATYALPGNAQGPGTPPMTKVEQDDESVVPSKDRIRNEQDRGDREASRKEKTRIEEEPPVEKRETASEFQNFIYASTGQSLPHFGHDLFKGVPSTFAPVDRIPVTADYVIGPGDEIVLRGWGQIDIDYRTSVDRLGNIFIPKVGSVSVAGLKYGQLERHLKATIGRVFHDFDLNVTLGQLRSIQIFIVGQARRPGSYTVSSLSTLVNAVFASGGPSVRGSMRHIQLKRNNQVITDFDLYDLLLAGDKSKDAPLLPGDVIYIPAIGPAVAVMGSVHVPAIYELRNATTLADIFKLAGGMTSTAATQKVSVERIIDGAVRSIDEFALDQAGMSAVLRDGDVVTVRTLSGRFDNTVTLRGNVAQPGRYPWKAGMRIKDFIPNRESLVTREFWQKQVDLGRDQFKVRTVPSTPYSLPNGPSKPLSQQDRANVKSEEIDPSETGVHPRREESEGPVHHGEAELTTDIKRYAPDINWDYAVIQRFDREHLTTNLIPFNLQKAIGGDEANNLTLEAGDVITVFSQADIQVSERKRSKFVRLEGEFKAPGVYEVAVGETLRQLAERVGGLTPQAYLFGSEFTRESARKTQQRRLDEFVARLETEVERATSTRSVNVLSAEEALSLKDQAESQRRLVDKLRQLRAAGRVVLGVGRQGAVEELPDILLEDGDRFFVPHQPATVDVIGAVYNDNSYIYDPGHTVKYYVKQAGGGTRVADTSHAMIIRADGSVVSKRRAGGWFDAGFDSLKLMPGDTVVIPEKLDKVGFLKGLKDWSQVIGQLALGATAIKILTTP